MNFVRFSFFLTHVEWSKSNNGIYEEGYGKVTEARVEPSQRLSVVGQIHAGEYPGWMPNWRDELENVQLEDGGL